MTFVYFSIYLYFLNYYSQGFIKHAKYSAIQDSEELQVALCGYYFFLLLSDGCHLLDKCSNSIFYCHVFAGLHFIQ